ncbi:replication initiation protein [Saccharomonospora piscinae]|uniref:replication initiator n=1 Tax=Saccharomonospora piscinae TaxID=687388 RepID=UPI001105C3BB|nr:replication initiator [Saccharomonospora piscinae]TLW92100.1 replication initiation protein [Saccharomonospora piscinae]
MLTLEDRLSARLRAADYKTWRDKVHAVNGCARPIRLVGAHQLHDADTGAVIHHYGGSIFAPCGNRRETVCPACSDRYAADAFHLVRAGLCGGSKGVPERVTEHPRVFVTLTAPSFGKVHTRRVSRRGRVVPCGCGQTHHREDDPRIGTPLDPDTYDYEAAVLWQAHAGKLWHRFTVRLRRELAQRAGLRVRDFPGHARLSYGKVAEYQRRGLIHFHALVRLDGPDGPTERAPSWATSALLTDAITAAAGAAVVTTTRPDGARLSLSWGAQLDTRPVEHDDSEDADGIGERALAGYIAKYATKGTGTVDGADRPIRSELDIEHLRITEHHRRMIRTCWDLGGLDAYEDLNLRRWAHMLGFRGHFLTKSRAYSTTFKAIREDRRAFRLAEALDRLDLDPDAVLVVNDWQFTGAGYRDDAERELALGIAERLRTQRQHKYRQENPQ